MSMNEFLENRKSIRDFKAKDLSKTDIDKVGVILETTNKLSAEHSVYFKLYNDGNKIYNSLEGEGGYEGVMIKANHYIAMHIKEKTEEAFTFGAYYMESMITQLDKIGIGSCWITISKASNESKAKALDSETNVDFLLGIGYAPSELGFGKKRFSSRIGVEDFVYDGNLSTPINIDKLETYGLDELFSFVRFAPSTKNEQPWRFVLNNDNFDLYIENYKGIDNLVDAGIVMYYYKELARYSNVDVDWYINSEKKDQGNFKYISSVNF